MTSPAYVSKVAKFRLRQGETSTARQRADRWRSSSDLESKCGVGGGGGGGEGGRGEDASVGGRRGHRQRDNLTRVRPPKKKKK